MANTVISTKDLTKDYGKGRGAIDITFSVYPGEIVGFIGPNGAGKSTTMRLIMGYSAPDRGSVSLFDKTIHSERDLNSVIGDIGFFPSEGGLYEYLTPKELFTYSSQLYGKNYNARALEMAEVIKLDVDKQIKKLSFGNKKKTGLIYALMHSPKLVILDEPTAGLDPLIQQEILKFLKGVRDQGGSVFLSSHVLAEVQSVCDRVIMIKDSKIILEDSTENILRKAVNIITLQNPDPQVVEGLSALPVVKKTEQKGIEFMVYVEENKPVIDFLVRHNVYDFYLKKPSLENMFLEYYES
ncbi:MAG: ABC transporter ATP-binding protein [Candidatus Dojkabacteria bacterium]